MVSVLVWVFLIINVWRAYVRGKIFTDIKIKNIL